MTKKTMKHKPPSRIRYERDHPTVSVRMSKKIKSTLDEIRAKTGHSYAEILKMALRKAKQLWSSAYEEGYTEAVNQYGIYYCCSKCGEPIFITYDDPCYQAVIAYLKRYGWGHAECGARIA
jgi:hypothetical protein